MHSLWCNLQHTSNLVVRKAAEIVQLNHLAARRRQSFHRLIHLCCFRAGFANRRRSGLMLELCAVPLRAGHTTRRPPANFRQPRRESRPISKRLQPAAGHRKCLLRGILGQVLIRESTSRYANRHAVVALVQLAKTIDVTAAGRRYKFSVRVVQSACPQRSIARSPPTPLVFRLRKNERQIAKDFANT